MGELQGFWSAEPRDFIQVGAGGEEFLVAGDDEGFQQAALRLTVQLLNRGQQSSHAGQAEYVCAARGSKLQDGVIAFATQGKILAVRMVNDFSPRLRVSAFQFF